MKRQQLINYLYTQNCVLKREGSSHSIFANSITGKRTPIPRHAELGDLLCNEICKQLGVPKIK